MLFRVVGIDREGKPATREVEAATAEEAVQRLQGEWEQVSRAESAEVPQARLVRVSAADLAFLTSHLASVVRAGLPVAPAVAQLAGELRRGHLADALQHGAAAVGLAAATPWFLGAVAVPEPILHAARMLKRGRLSAALEQVAADLSAGKSLHDAFAARPEVFPPLLPATIAAGEKSGNLALALSHLGEQFTLLHEMRHRWVEAAIYPGFLVLFGMFALWLTGFVGHSFRRVFKDMGTALPTVTEICLAFSAHAHEILAVVAVTLLAAALALLTGKATGWGRRRLDYLLLRLPLVGRIVRTGLLARFCHTLGMLLRSGVPMPESLRLCGPIAGNAVFADIVQDLEAHVARGGGLAGFVELEPFFPGTLAWMLTCGETRGDLPGALVEIGRLYQQDARHRFAVLESLVGPFLILLAAIFSFAILVLGMFLPMIQLIRSMS